MLKGYPSAVGSLILSASWMNCHRNAEGPLNCNESRRICLRKFSSLETVLFLLMVSRLWEMINECPLNKHFNVLSHHFPATVITIEWILNHPKWFCGSCMWRRRFDLAGRRWMSWRPYAFYYVVVESPPYPAEPVARMLDLWRRPEQPQHHMKQAWER